MLFARMQGAGISFVGSSPVAKHVYQLGTLHGKRVQALGGAKISCVVLPDALMEKAGAVALESIIGCAGERCLAGSVIVSVGEKTHQEIESRITLLAKEITVGDGLDPKVQMGPLISKRSQTASSKFNSIGHRSRSLASYWMDEKMSTICWVFSKAHSSNKFEQI